MVRILFAFVCSKQRGVQLVGTLTFVIMGVAQLLLCVLCVSVAGHIRSKNYHVSSLVKQPCSKRERARRGDEVTIRLSVSSFSEGRFISSKGEAEQNVIIGRHSVPPLNKGMKGMCVGEKRQVSISRAGEPGMQYIVEMVDIAEGPVQVKPVYEL